MLQIAVRARNSNVVGMMVDLNLKFGKPELVDHLDERGRTVLHYDCRARRPESIAILLDAGADANLKDINSLTPLDMCVQFEQEDFRWNDLAGTADRVSYVDAAYVTLGDLHRPRGFDNGNWSWRLSLTSKLSSEHHTVGVRPIIRLLVAHGADIEFMFSKDRAGTFDAALAADCEVMCG